VTFSSPIKPSRLSDGNQVAIVSPSFPALGRWPHRALRARAYLESLGLRVRIMPHATETTGWTAGSVQHRIEDLHSAFADPDIKAVVCATGGNHSNELVPHLDYELIAANPKIFQGYSDMTVLHWAILKHARLTTFYGPAATLEMAEYPEVLEFTDHSLRAAWFGDKPLRFDTAPEWTEEFLDFNAKLDLERPRALQRNPGRVWLQPGAGTGPLLGGCLESIMWHVKGSAEWLDLAGAILFLETSEEAPPPPDVDAYLTDLSNLGILDHIAGLVIGRPMLYTPENTELLWEVVSKHMTDRAVPVLANIDCGHTDPMLTLPLGISVRLDSSSDTFEAAEVATNPDSTQPNLDPAGR
jgi:muramoyltetrapeptide carboxypeptidase LdcA involved in peptidoglycan recycling